MEWKFNELIWLERNCSDRFSAARPHEFFSGPCDGEGEPTAVKQSRCLKPNLTLEQP